MKKYIFLMLSILCIIGIMLTGCSEKKKNVFTFNENILTLSDGTSINIGSRVEIDKNSYTIISLTTKESSTVDASVKINGIAVGSKASDFINAFGLSKNFAMWETYLEKSPEEVIPMYNSFSDKEISYSSYDDRFLTVGFMFQGGDIWETMHFNTINDIWNLRPAKNAFGVIAIVSAGLDRKGTITKIVIDYGEYFDFMNYSRG